MNKKRTKCERDKKGRFKYVNGNGRYKRKQRDGKAINEHVLVWQEYHKRKVPKGSCIHHINGDKKDNRIENLELMKISEHTRMHFKEFYKKNEVWNKYLPKEKQPCYGRRYNHDIQTINKIKINWFLKYLDSNIDIWKLKDKGYTTKLISKKLNLTVDQVNHRWKGFNKSYLSWASVGGVK